MKKICLMNTLRVRYGWYLLLILLTGISLLATTAVADELKPMFVVVPATGPVPLNVTFVDQSEGEPTAWAWDLDGDNTWDSYEQNPHHTYTTPNTYYPNLTVWNGTGGPLTTTSYMISVNATVPPLNASFAASPRTGHPSLNVSFIDQSVGAKNWSWDFGDNFTGTEKYSKNPLHTYTTPGWYNVTLNISDNYSFEDGRTTKSELKNFIHVLQIDPPQADFTASPQSGLANLTVSFIDQTPGTDNLTYFWDFGDDTIDMSQQSSRNPVHFYTTNGSFNVSVLVTGSGGPTLVDKTGYITIGTPPAPTADFAVVPASGTAPLNVSFIGLANGTGHLTYEWDFGDESSHKFGRNLVHTYNLTGTYPVTLNVSDGTRTGSVTRSSCVIVKEVETPSVAFTASPLSGKSPLNVSFIDLSTNLNSTPGYQWWFGDGEISKNRSPVHRYNSSGLFDVCLTVISDGVTSKNQMSEFIQVADRDMPRGMFTATPRNGTSPLEVSFIDQSISEETLSYDWDFGDESLISHEQNPVHLYSEPGFYNVTLGIKDANNVSDIIRQSGFIEVRNPALQNVDFTVSPSKGSIPLTVSFIDQTTGEGPFTYLWDFGDGSNKSYTKNPSHVYEAIGLYSVNLTVTGPLGSSVAVRENLINATKYTGINSSIDFGAIPSYGNPPLQVNFVDQSFSNGGDYLWDFGDGTTSSEKNPTKMYTSEGDFPVTLHIGGLGLSNVTKSVQVQSLNASYDLSVSGATPYLVTLTDTSVGYPTGWYWSIRNQTRNNQIFSSYTQNTTASIRKAGKYSVILTTWNDRYKSSSSKSITLE